MAQPVIEILEAGAIKGVFLRFRVAGILTVEILEQEPLGTLAECHPYKKMNDAMNERAHHEAEQGAGDEPLECKRGIGGGK